MPTYEYACPNCGARFEIWQRMSDDPLTTCQTCGGAIHRVLYPAGIVFKGGGFYSTDNRHDSAAKVGSAASDKTDKTDSNGTSGTADSTGSGSASTGSASSGESKPAAAAPKD